LFILRSRGRSGRVSPWRVARLARGSSGACARCARIELGVTQLVTAGHWREGDPPILVIFDAGYDPMRLACRLADLPVEVLGRLRSDRVLHFPVPAWQPDFPVPAWQPGTQGRPRRHGSEFAVADPAT
jgi:hypothetical protein